MATRAVKTIPTGRECKTVMTEGLCDSFTEPLF